ncbi:MAG: hypothetical protein C0485_16190 [Pirellula sp.]|nr:hypothetical protein [Pirellula sp.]
MRSISTAMTWELLVSGRLALAATGLSMAAVPILVMTSLFSVARLDPQDETIHMLHLLFMQTNIFAGIVVMLGLVHQSTRPLFPQPATSRTLANGRLFPAASLLTLQVLLWTATLNAVLRINWPVWEPAIFAVAALTASFAVLWLFHGSYWMILGLTFVAALFSFWVKSHFGPIFGMPRHAWSPMGPIEGIALAGVALAFHQLAVAGFARARRGEPPLSLGIAAWLNSLPEWRKRVMAPFATSDAAQRWYFQRRVWITPVAVLSVCLMALVIWGFASGDSRELVNGFAFGSWGLCCAAALGGVILGSIGSKDDVVIGQFLATRPITSGDMARELLHTAALSWAFAWLTWAILFALILCALQVLGYAPVSLIPKEFNFRTFAAALLTSWGLMGNFATVALMGRARLVYRVLLGISTAVVVGILMTKYALTPLAADRLYGGLLSALGLASVAGTSWSLYAAQKRRLITPRIAWLAVASWGALTAFTFYAIPTVEMSNIGHWLFLGLLLIGSLALVVAPLATAPLALAWNRTR